MCDNAVLIKTRGDDGRDELDVRYEVTHPLGADWPVVSAFGLRGSVRTRERFSRGMDGAIAHWRDYARVFIACDAMSGMYRAWRAAVTHVEPAPATLDGADEDKLLASLDQHSEFRAAVAALIAEGAA